MSVKKRPPDRFAPFEEAYFHIGNGGLTLSIQQRWKGEESYSFENANGGITEVKADPSHTYVLRATLSCFGSSLSVNIPLGTRTMVTWLRDALDRTAKAMDMKATKWRPEFAFSDYGATHIDDTDIDERDPDISFREGAEVPRPARVGCEAQSACSKGGEQEQDVASAVGLQSADIEFLKQKTAECEDPAQKVRLEGLLALFDGAGTEQKA